MTRLLALLLLWPCAVAAQSQPAPPSPSAPAAAAVTPPSISDRQSHNCARFYPMPAIMRRESGTTGVKFLITVTGTTKDVTVSTTSGFADLDQATVACASQFKYSPAMQDGHPIEVSRESRIVWDTPQEPVPTGPAHDCRHEAKQLKEMAHGIHIVVAVDGSVKSVVINPPSGDDALNQELIACISKWQFKPARRLGQPVEWRLDMPLIALLLPLQ